VERLLILLALYKVRKLLDGDLRLRTACDLEPVDRDHIVASRPKGYTLPNRSELENALKNSIEECKHAMTNTTVTYEDELKRAKDDKKSSGDGEDSSDDDESDDN